MYFFIDKLLYVLLFFEKSNELKQFKYNYEYSKNFLQEDDFGERYKKILGPLVSEAGGIDNIVSIHLIKSSISDDIVFKKIDSFITMRLYALLQFYEVNDSRLDDFQIFNSKNLRLYLVKKKNSKQYCIYLTELYAQKLSIRKFYGFTKGRPQIFKRRQLVYNNGKGFVSI
jgi:hypothetical protein